MNCKDCYLRYVCKEDYIRRFEKYEMVEDKCNYAKDNSKIIELPCKVGDTVYHLKDIYEGTTKKQKFKKTIIEPLVVDSFVIGDTGKWHANTCNNDRNEWIYQQSVDFGRYVFTTKEEAEKRLEELNNG